eukprot:1083730-Rhodomonas_salina.2
MQTASCAAHFVPGARLIAFDFAVARYLVLALELRVVGVEGLLPRGGRRERERERGERERRRERRRERGWKREREREREERGRERTKHRGGVEEREEERRREKKSEGESDGDLNSVSSSVHSHSICLRFRYCLYRVDGAKPLISARAGLRCEMNYAPRTN